MTVENLYDRPADPDEAELADLKHKLFLSFSLSFFSLFFSLFFFLLRLLHLYLHLLPFRRCVYRVMLTLRDRISMTHQRTYSFCLLPSAWASAIDI
jgi:hypothetical protein